MDSTLNPLKSQTILIKEERDADAKDRRRRGQRTWKKIGGSPLKELALRRSLEERSPEKETAREAKKRAERRDRGKRTNKGKKDRGDEESSKQDLSR